MSDQMTAVLVGNAGVLLKCGDVKLLIDGLYQDNSGRFSNVPDFVWKELRLAQGLYENLDGILFSHSHPDHFNSGRAMLCLARQTPKLVILPAEEGGGTADLLGYLKGSRIPHALLNSPLPSCQNQASGRERFFSLPEGVSVTALPTVHMGNQYREIPHFSYLIAAGGKHILFLADAGADENCFRPLEGRSIRSVFVTPLFFHSKAGQDILRRIVRPKRVVIYHLPFEGQDPNGYLKMARRDRERYQREDLTVDLFCEAGQMLVI